MELFESLGVIRNEAIFQADALGRFSVGINQLRDRGHWDKQDLVDLFYEMLPDFAHLETGKYLDQRM